MNHTVDPRKQFHWHWKNVAGQVIINGYDLTSPESIADYLYWVGYEEQQAKNLEYLLNQDRITL